MTGCQPCPTSSFVNDCEGCTVLGCQLSCDSCLNGNTRSGTPPAPLTIPAGGCQVYNDNAKLICIPGSVASCPLGEHSAFPNLIANTLDGSHHDSVHALVLFCECKMRECGGSNRHVCEQACISRAQTMTLLAKVVMLAVLQVRVTAKVCPISVLSEHRSTA